MALQTFATRRKKSEDQPGARIRRLARRLPEIYAARDEKDVREKTLDLREKEFEHKKSVDVQNIEMGRRGFKHAKEQGRRAEGAAFAGLGLTAGIAGLKMRASGDADWMQGGEGMDWGSAGFGGFTGGAVAAGTARSLGTKKKWKKGLAGAVGGGAMTALAGGDDPLSIGAGALIGGGIGALF